MTRTVALHIEYFYSDNIPLVFVFAVGLHVTGHRHHLYLSHRKTSLLLQKSTSQWGNFFNSLLLSGSIVSSSSCSSTQHDVIFNESNVCRVLRPWTEAWCLSSATLQPSETPPWDATPSPTPSVWWRAAKGRYSSFFLPPKAPVAVTSPWPQLQVTGFTSSVLIWLFVFQNVILSSAAEKVSD